MLDGKRKILVVDDEPAILSIISQMLGKIIDPQIEEIEVWTAPNGAIALEHLKQPDLKFDLALVDYVLPDMSGLRVVDHIKRNNPDCHVTLMSGYRVEDDAQKTGVGFMKKPFDAEDIKAILQKEEVKND